eukprot:Blabericola_migrator_1__4099@NODE_224_length_11141_cov_42_071880_g190_i0_p4_GENE_NODE_224_length_11141_cov_42_071880_g190_i0NODE_224_length_11141_cov_42_071880_g190_i0_p4_ORF_typecomplete_len249_score39_38_NODE_224_length_11141_cov_42_071880_g190_i088919637
MSLDDQKEDGLACYYWTKLMRAKCNERCGQPGHESRCRQCIRRYQMSTYFVPYEISFRNKIVEKTKEKYGDRSRRIDLRKLREATLEELQRIVLEMDEAEFNKNITQAGLVNTVGTTTETSSLFIVPEIVSDGGPLAHQIYTLRPASELPTVLIQPSVVPAISQSSPPSFHEERKRAVTDNEESWIVRTKKAKGATEFLQNFEEIQNDPANADTPEISPGDQRRLRATTGVDWGPRLRKACKKSLRGS